ncbi:alpha/beta hydrolase [Halopseudomonas nanhaiensis]|uniref:alpha/beta fold hydrolase n=1 Tax=Halopseudomonas nanhaiensis TaxID=2830842 RepID=UPI001CC1542C|nr:alpha/beta hydrolase [Halopseudomonas nanhaiensis]UAW99265.1 alpha/beta hydrolase [Halopseudomonas nanhaiensis]
MLNTTIHGSGHPLIWGHGLLGSTALETATGWFHPDQSQAVRRIRYDARGHGQSSPGRSAADHQWARLGQDMLDIAHQHAGQPRFALGGQSMGCASALYAALLEPGAVSHLVLALPPTAWTSRPAQVERYGKMLGLIRARGVASLVALARQFPTLPPWLHEAHPGDNAKALHTMEQFDPTVLQPILEGAMQSDLPPREALTQLTMPALILAWEGDGIHPVATAEMLAQTLPAANLQIIDTAAQLSCWPRLIDDFLSSQT